MGKGLSKQQNIILGLLKERGENGLYGSFKDYVWMDTREIVMALRPDVEAYLAEDRRWGRFARRNGMRMPHEEFHKLYLEHETKLKVMPNYHTARTSITRALRGLVKRGLVIRHPWRGMYQKQGRSAAWLLPEYITTRTEANPKYLELLRLAYDPEYREQYEQALP